LPYLDTIATSAIPKEGAETSGPRVAKSLAWDRNGGTCGVKLNESIDDNECTADEQLFSPKVVW